MTPLPGPGLLATRCVGFTVWPLPCPAEAAVPRQKQRCHGVRDFRVSACPLYGVTVDRGRTRSIFVDFNLGKTLPLGL